MTLSICARIVPLAVLSLASAISSSAAVAAELPAQTLPQPETLLQPKTLPQPAAAQTRPWIARPHWLRDPRSGCEALYHWDFDAIRDVSWSGACVDGHVAGAGSLSVVRVGWTETIAGNFVDGRLEGQGSMDASDGRYHKSGEFHDGFQNGEGKASWSSGMHYEGNFRNHGFRGKGKLTWPGGDSFDGFFVSWPDSGKGTLKYTDGWEFDGDFVNDIPAKGITVHKPDGTRVEGDFVGPSAAAGTTPLNPEVPSSLLKPNAVARVEFRYTVAADGTVKDIVLTLPSDIPAADTAATNAIAKWRLAPATVNGISVEYKPSGYFVFSYGTKNWLGGGHYEGPFINGAFDGQGSIRWPGGDKYTGRFFRGFENGHGTFTWANGDSYDGDFHAGTTDGHGKLQLHDGTRLEGDFVPPTIDKSVPAPDIIYPPSAIPLRRQGIVVVRFRVGVDRSIKNVRVIGSSGFKDFDDEAISEVSRTRMIPGTLNGKPFELEALREFQFLLR